jgi:hypothetical protein
VSTHRDTNRVLLGAPPVALAAAAAATGKSLGVPSFAGSGAGAQLVGPGPVAPQQLEVEAETATQHAVSHDRSQPPQLPPQDHRDDTHADGVAGAASHGPHTPASRPGSAIRSPLAALVPSRTVSAAILAVTVEELEAEVGLGLAREAALARDNATLRRQVAELRALVAALQQGSSGTGGLGRSHSPTHGLERSHAGERSLVD